MTTGPSADVDVEATPEDVAALLTARTKDAQGNELGHWSEDTRPTYDQVAERIVIARALVRDGLGPIPDGCQEGFESCVALRAALLCEAAFWPEQIQNNQSAFAQLRDLYSEVWAGVQACIDRALAHSAYDLDVSGWDDCRAFPVDWWQRNLDPPPGLRVR